MKVIDCYNDVLDGYLKISNEYDSLQKKINKNKLANFQYDDILQPQNIQNFMKFIRCEKNKESYVKDYKYLIAFLSSAIYLLPDTFLKPLEYVVAKNNLSKTEYIKEALTAWIMYFSCISTILLWGETKQIYSIDDDFIEALMQTENIKIPVDIENIIPYKNICINLDHNTVFPDIDCIFISVFKPNDEIGLQSKCNIGITLHYLNHNFSSYILKLSEVKDGFYVKKLIANQTNNQKDILFVTQFLLYLCAANKDVQENDVTKKTYKPNKNKNLKIKFSDIKQWDVGYRIGNTIRLNSKVKNDSLHANTENQVDVTDKTIIKHSMSPHVRRAHWHHYWVGKGRTELVLKWIGISFVGGKDVVPTLHRVKA